MNFDCLPPDVHRLIAVYLDFQYLPIYFEKYNQLKFDPKFWLSKLNYTISYYKTKYPKYYQFDCSLKQQEYFYTILTSRYSLMDSFPICLYIFNICIPENEKYFEPLIKDLWYFKRRLLPPKWEYLPIFEEGLPMDYLIELIKRKEEINNTFILYIFIKFGWSNQLAELIKLYIEQKFNNNNYPELIELIDRKEMANKLLVKEKEILELDRKKILQSCKNKKYWDKSLNKNFIDYLICPYILNFKNHNCLQILRWLKGPVIKLPTKIKQRNKPMVYITKDTENLVDLLYYIIKEDDIKILEKLYCYRTRDFWFSFLVDWIEPESNIYKLITNFLSTNNFGARVLCGNFQTIYSLLKRSKNNFVIPNLEVKNILSLFIHDIDSHLVPEDLYSSNSSDSNDDSD